jgi:tetratricopeptide (TPR) repeat protein
MHSLRLAILCDFYDDQAISCVILAEHWLEDHPDDKLVTLKYAEMLYLLTRYDDAIQVYLDALEKFPENRCGIYAGLGGLYRYRGQFSEAEIWFRKATEANSDNATFFTFLGAVQARQGNLVEAEASHRRATKCATGCIDEAWHNLGLVLRGQGYLLDAAECFRKAIKLYPEYADAKEALRDVEWAMKKIATMPGAATDQGE